MRRGVYFDGWYPNQHNYHPSLPARRLKMVDEVEDMHATTLVWSALGGGSISLAHLEQEAYEDVPARFRFHGHINDSEFVAECVRRGIEVFGVVFEAQGWEFPAEYSDDGRVLAVNELRGAGRRGWLGLREFTQSSGPASWPPFSHYFPDGLVDSRGEVVTDLWDECCSRDLAGAPLRGGWVESPDREHVCHFMCRNNPVWRQYLKAVIRIQVDAGVTGVQLDESETPFGAFGYGGCFCRDCMAGFGEYLAALPEPPDELAAVDLATFDYAAWLRGQGIAPYTPIVTLPLARLFADYNLRAHHRYFAELAAYAKEYGRSVGRDVLVAGNFYNGNPEYDAIVDSVDVMVTEMHSTQYVQPWWFRHVEGLARGRDVLIAENPYGGVVPEIIDALAAGRGYDRLRTTFYEGAAMGPSMTFPYGSWMGSVIEDSFWAPKRLLDEVGTALAATDHLRGHVSRNEVAVLYPVADANQGEFDGPRWAIASAYVEFGAIADDLRIPYWRVVHQIGAAQVPFDVLALCEEGTRANDVTAGRLARYRYVVAPECRTVSREQHDELVRYVTGGGTLVVLGSYGVDLPVDERERLLSLPGCVRDEGYAVVGLLADRQVTVVDGGELGVNTVALDGGEQPRTALHLVNYAYDEAADATATRDAVTLAVRLPHAVTSARLHRPGAEPQALGVTTEPGTGRTVVVVPGLEIYGVVELGG